MKLDGNLSKKKTIYCEEQDLYLYYCLSARVLEERRTAYDLWIEQRVKNERESCFFCDIATSLSMAQRIWDLFTEGCVTPITAQDILEELLSDGAFLYADDM